MIGQLPTSLAVDEVNYPINSDYRAALTVFTALSDSELSPMNKSLTMLEIIYTPIATEDNPNPEPNIPSNTAEAMNRATWFLNVGLENPSHTPEVKTIDYEQDEQLLFSAINQVAKTEVRALPYMHWWTFYAWCQAISSETILAHICNIRYKKARGEKLDKHEQKFYRENKHLIDFRTSEDAYEAMVRELRGE